MIYTHYTARECESPKHTHIYSSAAWITRHGLRVPTSCTLSFIHNTTFRFVCVLLPLLVFFSRCCCFFFVSASFSFTRSFCLFDVSYLFVRSFVCYAAIFRRMLSIKTWYTICLMTMWQLNVSRVDRVVSVSIVQYVRTHSTLLLLLYLHFALTQIYLTPARTHCFQTAAKFWFVVEFETVCVCVFVCASNYINDWMISSVGCIYNIFFLHWWWARRMLSQNNNKFIKMNGWSFYCADVHEKEELIR